MPSHPDQTTALSPLSPAQIDAAVAVAALATSLVLLAVGDPGLWDESTGEQALALTLAGLANLPLVAARRSPLAVFVFTAAAQSALAQLAMPVGPPIGPTIAVFALGFGGSPVGGRRTFAVVVAMLLLHAYSTSRADDPGFPAPELLFGSLLWGGAWLAGDRARLRRERMTELEDRALRAEREAERERNLAAAEERTRIARDLHDSAGHAINVILIHAGAGRLHAERDPARAREALRTIEDVARETVTEIDHMVGMLREGRDEEGGVEPPPGLAALDGLVERHRAAGMKVAIERRCLARTLPPSLDRGAYRIVQEALTNAARHGDGEARVEVAYGSRALELTVTNPAGDGDRRGEGHGLVGMRERTVQLGGRLDLYAHGESFVVRARLPLPEERR